MARLLTTNMAATILGGSIGGTSGDTTITLTTGTGALFPALPHAGDYFHGVLVNSAGQSEIVKVTARSTDSLTVVRGQEGTTIRAFSAADRFELRVTAADIEFIQSSYWSRESAAVARVSGTEFTVVGDQTLRYVQHRAVNAIQTSDDQGFVVSSSYSAGPGLTTVVVEGMVIDSGLAAIEYGQDPTSAPKYGANSSEVKVSSDDTTGGYLDGKLALASGSGLVLAVTSPAGNEVLTIKADSGTTANKLVKLDGSGKIPALDGSQLINLPGGSGYKTIFIGGGAMTPSQTAGATPAIVEDGTNDLTRPCMMFKGVTADTSAEWCHAMPEDWDGGTVKAKVMWSGQAGCSASDTVRFSLAAGAFSDDNALDAALGSAVTMDDTVTAAGDMQTTPASAALTIGGTPALGDLVRWKLTRDYDYGGQPMTEDAAVLGVWVQYYADQTPSAW